MKILPEFYEYLWLNEDESENAPKYVPCDNVPDDILNKLKKLNESSKFYTGKDLIAFS